MAFVQLHLLSMKAVHVVGKGGAGGQSPPSAMSPNVSSCSVPGEHGPVQLPPLGGCGPNSVERMVAFSMQPMQVPE